MVKTAKQPLRATVDERMRQSHTEMQKEVTRKVVKTAARIRRQAVESLGILATLSSLNGCGWTDRTLVVDRTRAKIKAKAKGKVKAVTIRMPQLAPTPMPKRMLVPMPVRITMETVPETAGGVIVIAIDVVGPTVLHGVDELEMTRKVPTPSNNPQATITTEGGTRGSVHEVVDVTSKAFTW